MIEPHLQLTLKVALDAGKAIMEVYNVEFDVEIYDDKLPLIIADKRASDVINSYLTKTECPIISEENKQITK